MVITTFHASKAIQLQRQILLESHRRIFRFQKYIIVCLNHRMDELIPIGDTPYKILESGHRPPARFGQSIDTIQCYFLGNRHFLNRHFFYPSFPAHFGRININHLQSVLRAVTLERFLMCPPQDNIIIPRLHMVSRPKINFFRAIFCATCTKKFVHLFDSRTRIRFLCKLHKTIYG